MILNKNLPLITRQKLCAIQYRVPSVRQYYL